MKIVVTNGTEKAIKGRYAGEDYEFPVGVAVAIPEEVARHVFNFGLSDKSQALSRLGWMTSSNDADDAYSRLALITFGVSNDANKVSNDGPLVNADGAAGGAESEDSASPKVTKTQRLKKGSEQII